MKKRDVFWFLKLLETSDPESAKVQEARKWCEIIVDEQMLALKIKLATY